MSSYNPRTSTQTYGSLIATSDDASAADTATVSATDTVQTHSEFEPTKEEQERILKAAILRSAQTIRAYVNGRHPFNLYSSRAMCLVYDCEDLEKLVPDRSSEVINYALLMANISQDMWGVWKRTFGSPVQRYTVDEVLTLCKSQDATFVEFAGQPRRRT